MNKYCIFISFYPELIDDEKNDDNDRGIILKI